MVGNQGAKLLGEAELEYSQVTGAAVTMVKGKIGGVVTKIFGVLRQLISDTRAVQEEAREEVREVRAELVKLRALVERGMDFDNAEGEG